MKAKVFETCKIELQQRGLHYFKNNIGGITPPEFLLLQELHGPHSVKFIEKQEPAVLTRMSHDGKWQKRPITASELKNALSVKYTEARFKNVFPGANPILPHNFEDIGVSAESQGGEAAEPVIEENNEDLWEDMSAEEVQASKLADELVSKKKSTAKKAG